MKICGGDVEVVEVADGEVQLGWSSDACYGSLA